MKKKIISIGELLWDVLPTGKKPGGSSMNVALNLHKQGNESTLISAVGKDELGKELIDYLSIQGFPTNLIQTNNLPTSTVQVTLDDEHQASYTIVEPVAWDSIQTSKDLINSVKEADAFVYCSLTCRNEESKNTILNLLKHAKLKIFDINLRAPFFTVETLTLLLIEADILKVNEHELVYLKESLKLSGSDDKQLLKELADKFNVKIICLTVGDKGAYVFTATELLYHKGYKIEVKDTVGAGDAFLATFVSSYLNGFDIWSILDRACKIGAFVASQTGANPDYKADEVFASFE